MLKRQALFIVLLGGCFQISAQFQAKSLEDYIISRTTDTTGKEIIGVIVPGIPPKNHREPIAYPTRSASTLPYTPAYDWSFGCSATSAAMAAGYYDNNGYSNMYTGPTNGGVAPMDNSSWGTVIINGETRSQCPISATRNGLDGRMTLGHVDDYWVQYNSSSPDPYITGGWTQHDYGDCTGDYMGTNQSALSNSDGATTFYFYATGEPLYNYTGCEPDNRDGCHGLRDFYESRGYTVVQNYTQCIYGYNGNTIGFTFSQYVQEINAGRPVLIQLSGHTVLGYGYDEATSTVYLHDTWDYNSHSMTWGGSYAGMNHYAVTVVELEAAVFGPNANFVADNLTPPLNATVNFTDMSNGSPAINSWTWSITPSTYNFVDGTSATTRHPKVQFTAGGFYSVSLTVSNGTSNDTETKTDYILAIDCSDTPFPLTEDFSDGALPACWTIIDHQGNGQVWLFNNPGSRTVNTTSSANGFAILDSDAYGPGNTQNCDLVTPMLDLSDVLGVKLTFQHYYYHYTGSSATLSYSTDNGNTWTVLQSWTTTTANPATYSQDISDMVAGQDSVRFKWNYTGTYGWFWAVDDIAINSDIPGLWTGAVSNNWNDTDNWADGNVPGSTTNIKVHPEADFWPVYNGDLTLGTACGDLTLEGNAQMTINGDLNIAEGKCLAFTGTGQLNITGDWINSGTFSPGLGTINFTGTDAAGIIFNNVYSDDASDYELSNFTVGMTTLVYPTISVLVNSDDGFVSVPIGFDFNYCGTTYDSVWLTVNGMIHFDLTGNGSPSNEYLFTADAPANAIAPWWDNLKDDGTSVVRYKTEGITPNQVFTAEWHRILAYNTVSNTRLKFQVKLFESSNIIEFHYGIIEGTVHSASESASIGIKDATGGAGHFIDATTGSTTTGNYSLVSPGNWPAVNYRFTPVLQSEIFHNLMISKTGASLNIGSNVIVEGELIQSAGGSLTISSGNTLKVNGSGN